MPATPATLPDGYTVRQPTHDDIPAIIALMRAFDVSFYGDEAEQYTEEDVQEDFRRQAPAPAAWVIFAPDGSLAAYAMVNDSGYGQFNADGYVHPAHLGRGLGTWCVRTTEGRARELVPTAPEGARVVLGNGVLLRDTAARAILEREGYALARVFWLMGVDLTEEPAPVMWPEGITVRNFIPGQDEHAIFEAVEEAFSDHWGHVPRPFERWIARTSRSDFDPSLWFLAMDGDQIAGFALCRRRPDRGWVDTLGVRRPWRRKGVAGALLRHSFRELYQRGDRKIGLGVDAQSLTGATRVYEREGMRPTLEATIYEKELRPGEDLSVQQLDDE